LTVLRPAPRVTFGVTASSACTSRRESTVIFAACPTFRFPASASNTCTRAFIADVSGSAINV
jgi:hypothetical protein